MIDTCTAHMILNAATCSANSTDSTLCVPSASGNGLMRGQTQLSTSHSQPPLVDYPPTAKATPATGLGLAQRGNEATVVDSHRNAVSRGAAAQLGVSMQQHDKLQDTDSLSSLPLSVPEEAGYVFGDHMHAHLDLSQCVVVLM